MAHNMSNVLDEATLCRTVARLISETFNSLSVTIWLTDEQSGRLTLGASTSHSHADRGSGLRASQSYCKTDS
jgi:hypothetical protein